MPVTRDIAGSVRSAQRFLDMGLRGYQIPWSSIRGSWRAQAAGRLLAPLRSALIISGVLQAVITLVQLAPFVLL